jgi:hypothetical protein
VAAWAATTAATALTSKNASITDGEKLFPIDQLKADNVIYLITGRGENFRAIGGEVADGGSSLRCAAEPGRAG